LKGLATGSGRRVSAHRHGPNPVPEASPLLIAVSVAVPFVHNLGVFAKLFSEAVEAADLRPVEGIRVTGAACVQEVVFGVIRR
jgi:ABC-type phosphate/phosphonate transport system permease subunit